MLILTKAQRDLLDALELGATAGGPGGNGGRSKGCVGSFRRQGSVGSDWRGKRHALPIFPGVNGHDPAHGHQDVTGHAAKPGFELDELIAQLQATSVLQAAEYFPVSARTGEGVPELLAALLAKMPEGPAYYPPEMISDNEEAQWVAELVREQLLAVLKDELPYSVATRVTEWEWPKVRCEILVERESQKGMVIGKGGELLKQVGQKVRAQMAPGAYIELHVVVDKDWQQKPDRLERLGY